MVPEVRSTRDNFLSFWVIFCPFTRATVCKIKVKKKQNKIKKETPGNIIILHMCTIRTIVSCMVPEIGLNGQNFLSFWTIFCPFTLLTTRKMKTLKKWKKTRGVLLLYTPCTRNKNHMYDSWDMECHEQNFFIILEYFLSWVFLPFYPFCPIMLLNTSKRLLE